MGTPRRRTHSMKLDGRPSMGSSSIGVSPKKTVAMIPNAKNITKRTCQLRPKKLDDAPHAAMSGAENEAIAFTNCPKVSVDARFLPPVTTETSGFSEVCIRALPMPRSDKATYITIRLDPPSNGNTKAIRVTNRLMSTVFLRPILFINMPVGTLKIKNQRNTSIGRTPFSVFVRLNSVFMLSAAVPTKSTKPMQKKQSITGIK